MHVLVHAQVFLTTDLLNPRESTRGGGGGAREVGGFGSRHSNQGAARAGGGRFNDRGAAGSIQGDDDPEDGVEGRGGGRYSANVVYI